MQIRWILTVWASALASASGDELSHEHTARCFHLVHEQTAAAIVVDDQDWKVVRIAARDLTLDVERVTGRRPELKRTTENLSPHTVLVGTIGRSPVIDRLVELGRLNVDDVKGLWEACIITSIEKPLPGVERGLIIAGSDRRGTAYGVYELSRRIGVSPWYWWADVTPRRRAALCVPPDRRRIGPPAVKYRGIFINDEMWGIRPWARERFAPDEGDGLGPKTYAKIFELLLRLRANYLWPAMHRGTIPFNYYAENKVVADDYAIVMGTSHIEPMLRNNIGGAEWDREEGTDWNYLTNRDAIYDYWERRIRTNGRYENVYTVGMRGKDDEAHAAGHTMKEKIDLLERVFRDQREILGKHVRGDVTQVPQVFIPYTEVLGIYDAGLRVPEDVTICWPDDNFGYIRRLPTQAEQTRVGGSGIYYHIQWLNGATTAYTWLNTTPPALIFAEMIKAWHYNVRNLWVVNVGDIKPGEVGMEFFLDMAWDPRRYRRDNVRGLLERWAARDIDADLASEIAAIMESHFRLGYTRRPEHLVQYRRNTGLRYSWFSHDHYNDEAQQRLDRYADIARRAQNVYDRLPHERKDAFFQLVLYPVQCAHWMNQKAIHADKNARYAAQGRASAAEYANKARAAAKRILALTEHYNSGLLTVGDKWKHMLSPAPGPWGSQRHQFEMPPLSDFDGLGPPTLEIGAEGGQGTIVAGLSVYTRGRRFIDLFNKGKGPIDWRATVSEPWLRLSEVEGRFTTECRLWVTVDWDRAPRGRDVEAVIVVTSTGGNRQVVVPVFHPGKPARDTVSGFVESHGYVSMEAEHFTRRRDHDGAGWRVVGGLGRSGDSVAVFPPTIRSVTEPSSIRAHSPALEYDVYVFSPGTHTLHVDALPTQPVAPGRGVRVAIAIDGGEPRVLDARTPRDVLANLRRISATVTVDRPGRHTLTVWMVDPGVLLDKLVLYTAAPRASYLGPPESYRR